MIDLVKRTIDFYIKHGSTPKTMNLTITNSDLLVKKWSMFVTIYYKWAIRWSAWNIKELKKNLAEEVIENTIAAISKDSRFSPISPKEAIELKLRTDYIIKRDLLKNRSIKDIEPIKSGVIVIKNDYTKMAAILPDIDPKITSWVDFIPVLKQKLWEKDFKESDYLIYEIKTEVKTSF